MSRSAGRPKGRGAQSPGSLVLQPDGISLSDPYLSNADIANEIIATARTKHHIVVGSFAGPVSGSAAESIGQSRSIVQFDLSSTQYVEPDVVLDEDDILYCWWDAEEVTRFHRACAVMAEMHMEDMKPHMNQVYDACAKRTVQSQSKNNDGKVIHKSLYLNDPCLQACLYLSDSPARGYDFRFHQASDSCRKTAAKSFLRIQERLLRSNPKISHVSVLASVSQMISRQACNVAVVMAQADAIIARKQDIVEHQKLHISKSIVTWQAPQPVALKKVQPFVVQRASEVSCRKQPAMASAIVAAKQELDELCNSVVIRQTSQPTAVNQPQLVALQRASELSFWKQKIQGTEDGLRIQPPRRPIGATSRQVPHDDSDSQFQPRRRNQLPHSDDDATEQPRRRGRAPDSL